MSTTFVKIIPISKPTHGIGYTKASSRRNSQKLGLVKSKSSEVFKLEQKDTSPNGDPIIAIYFCNEKAYLKFTSTSKISLGNEPSLFTVEKAIFEDNSLSFESVEYAEYFLSVVSGTVVLSYTEECVNDDRACFRIKNVVDPTITLDENDPPQNAIEEEPNNRKKTKSQKPKVKKDQIKFKEVQEDFKLLESCEKPIRLTTVDDELISEEKTNITTSSSSSFASTLLSRLNKLDNKNKDDHKNKADDIIKNDNKKTEIVNDDIDLTIEEKHHSPKEKRNKRKLVDVGVCKMTALSNQGSQVDFKKIKKDIGINSDINNSKEGEFLYLNDLESRMSHILLKCREAVSQNFNLEGDILIADGEIAQLNKKLSLMNEEKEKLKKECSQLSIERCNNYENKINLLNSEISNLQYLLSTNTSEKQNAQEQFAHNLLLLESSQMEVEWAQEDLSILKSEFENKIERLNLQHIEQMNMIANDIYTGYIRQSNANKILNTTTTTMNDLTVVIPRIANASTQTTNHIEHSKEQPTSVLMNNDQIMSRIKKTLGNRNTIHEEQTVLFQNKFLEMENKINKLHKVFNVLYNATLYYKTQWEATQLLVNDIKSDKNNLNQKICDNEVQIQSLLAERSILLENMNIKNTSEDQYTMENVEQKEEEELVIHDKIDDANRSSIISNLSYLDTTPLRTVLAKPSPFTTVLKSNPDPTRSNIPRLKFNVFMTDNYAVDKYVQCSLLTPVKQNVANLQNEATFIPLFPSFKPEDASCNIENQQHQQQQQQHVANTAIKDCVDLISRNNNEAILLNKNGHVLTVDLSHHNSISSKQLANMIQSEIFTKIIGVNETTVAACTNRGNIYLSDLRITKESSMCYQSDQTVNGIVDLSKRSANVIESCSTDGKIRLYDIRNNSKPFHIYDVRVNGKDVSAESFKKCFNDHIDSFLYSTDGNMYLVNADECRCEKYITNMTCPISDFISTKHGVLSGFYDYSISLYSEVNNVQKDIKCLPFQYVTNWTDNLLNNNTYYGLCSDGGIIEVNCIVGLTYKCYYNSKISNCHKMINLNSNTILLMGDMLYIVGLD